MNNFIFQKKLPRGYFSVLKSKPANAVTPKQVHGAKIVACHQAASNQVEADGLFWFWSELSQSSLPTVLTADCLPIVIIGKRGGAILHAGWRGVQQKIHLMPEVCNLEPEYYFIGPSIQSNSFEVTEEFHQFFPKSNNFSHNNNKIYFNLQIQVDQDLKQAFPKIKGESCGIDTFTNLEFNSYRRERKKINQYNVYHLNQDDL